MKILTKEQLRLFKFPENNKYFGNQEVISGIKRNVTQAIILSTGENNNTKLPFVDIRLWAVNNDTEEYVPTPKGLRLTLDQYAAFCTMLQDEFPTITNSHREVNVISIDSLLEKADHQSTT